MKELFLVFLGGIGSVFRFLISNYTYKMFVIGSLFPFGTLLVNILGCFIMGIITASLDIDNYSNLRYLLVIGFCGGFTTFSTFSIENLRFLQNEDYMLSIIYTFSSIVLGVGGIYLGLNTYK